MTSHAEIPKNAPPFDPARNDYPLSGEKVGPIWRAAWQCLIGSATVTEFVSLEAVADYVQFVHPEANRETIRTLLSRAAQVGILERETRTGQINGTGAVRKRTYLRIKVNP